MDLEQIVKYWLPIGAIIISVASFIYTLIIYRSNRRLATAQRYNYGLDKQCELHKLTIELRGTLLQISNKEIYKAFSQQIDNIRKELMKISAEFMQKNHNNADLSPIIVEKYISRLGLVNNMFQTLNEIISLYLIEIQRCNNDEVNEIFKPIIKEMKSNLNFNIN